jgi:hypothetical protein
MQLPIRPCCSPPGTPSVPGAARRCIDELGFYVAHEAVRLAFPLALEAAISLGDLDEAGRLTRVVAAHPRGDVPPFLRAQIIRADALVASARDDDGGVEESLLAAESAFRQLGYPYWTARALHDRADWLGRHGRLGDSTAPRDEATALFERMGAPAMPFVHWLSPTPTDPRGRGTRPDRRACPR